MNTPSLRCSGAGFLGTACLEMFVRAARCTNTPLGSTFSEHFPFKFLQVGGEAEGSLNRLWSLQSQSLSEEQEVSSGSKNMLASSARQHRLRLLALNVCKLPGIPSHPSKPALVKKALPLESSTSLDQLLWHRALSGTIKRNPGRVILYWKGPHLLQCCISNT